MSDTEGNDFMSQTIDKLPPDRAVAVAKIAARYRLAENDPAWLLVNAVVDADAAAAAAGEAAGVVRDRVEKIPEAIFQGTVKASQELAESIAASGKKIMDESETRAADVTAKTEAAITKATQAGSGALRAAMAGLEKAAQARQAQIVETWQTALGRAAEKEAKATLIRVAGWRWTQIAGALLSATALGVVLTVGGLVAAGKILPWGWELNPIPTAPCSLTQVARPGVGVGECQGVRG